MSSIRRHGRPRAWKGGRVPRNGRNPPPADAAKKVRPAPPRAGAPHAAVPRRRTKLPSETSAANSPVPRPAASGLHATSNRGVPVLPLMTNTHRGGGQRPAKTPPRGINVPGGPVRPTTTGLAANSNLAVAAVVRTPAARLAQRAATATNKPRPPDSARVAKNAAAGHGATLAANRKQS